MRLYLYIRLSSADADVKYKAESDSVASQRTLLRQFVAGRREFCGWDVEEFTDDGYTGTNGDRPAFERMIEHLKNGDASTVICKDFSRFFRDYTELGDYLERIFPFLGVRFISVNDGYDSDDYKGTTAGMEVVMKYILYSYYSRDLSQKVKAAVNVRMKRGEFVGSYAPYGYMKDPVNKHHLVPDPETAPIVRQIFDLAIEGRNTGEIAKFLNTRGYETPSQYFHRRFPESKKFRKSSSECCWDTSNVRMILSRLDYTGMLVCQRKNWKGVDHPRITDRDRSEWIVTPNCHAAIVSDAEFELANEVIKKRKKSEYVPKSYTLKSLIRCGECGRVMRRKTNVPHIHFYCDKSKHSVSTTCPLGEKFYEDELETVIVQDLRRMLALLVGEIELMKEAARKTKGSVANLKQNLMKAEKSIKQNHLSVVESYERYSDGKIGREDFLIIKEKLAAEMEKLMKEKSDIEADLTALEAAGNSELATWEKSAVSFLNTEEVTNQMLLHFIERVDVYTGMRIEIKYRFSDGLMETMSCSPKVDGAAETTGR